MGLFSKKVKCISCGTTVEPFPVASGMWSGTLGNIPKIEAYHAFVCESCGAHVCPVCSGKKATALGVREFVCTQCGHRPMKTIY